MRTQDIPIARQLMTLMVGAESEIRDALTNSSSMPSMPCPKAGR